MTDDATKEYRVTQLSGSAFSVRKVILTPHSQPMLDVTIVSEHTHHPGSKITITQNTDCFPVDGQPIELVIGGASTMITFDDVR